MANQAIITELDEIIAFAEELKQKALQCKKKLAPVSSGAGARKGSALNSEQARKLIGNRRKTLIKNSGK